MLSIQSSVCSASFSVLASSSVWNNKFMKDFNKRYGHIEYDEKYGSLFPLIKIPSLGSDFITLWYMLHMNLESTLFPYSHGCVVLGRNHCRKNITVVRSH